jgi:TatD DNase family protein
LESLNYLDIHSHLRTDSNSTIRVSSLSKEEILQGDSIGEYSSAGIHPWWIEDLTENDISELKKKIELLATNNKLWGIGETGIDRLYPEFLIKQRALFKWHFDLAESYQLPLIIHNVRSGSDFLELIKNLKPTTSWIFHDFRGNEDLVKSILKLHPFCFFSFGLSIDNSPQVRELLPRIPLENLFLETDHQKHLDIHDIYLRAAEQLKIDLDFLKAQMWHNFKKLSKSLQ